MKLFLDTRNFLQTIAEEAEKNSDAARALAEHLTETQLNWKPVADRWSIAQCLEHLAIASHKFDDLFPAALERARKKWPVKEAPGYKPSFMGGWLIRQVDPDTGRNLPAPKIFRPADSSNIQGALDSFLNQQERFLSFVGQSDGIDYNKTRLRSPVTPLIRYSLADAFVVTVVHGQRHLRQAQRVRELSEFPAS